MFMDFKISKDSGGSQPQEPHGEKKNQSALLVLLLILVGGFAYLYFFTDLIKPQQTQKTAEAPAPQVVKMPLPARENKPAGPDGKTPKKAEGPKVAATAPVTEAAPAAGPAEPVATDKTTATPAAKAVKASAAKAAPAQSAPTQSAQSAPTQSAKAAPAQVANASPPPAKVKEKTKKTSAAKPGAQKTAVKTKKTATGPWSILVGNYVLEEALSADMGRVRKAGFKPAIKPAGRKKTSMHRLLIAEYNDKQTAQSSLEKLSRQTSDAFVIEQGGKFAVYAGSYLQSEAANCEKDRLKAAGLTVTIKNADIAIPSQNLSVGPFKNKREAAAALGKLKNAGLRAKLLQK